MPDKSKAANERRRATDPQPVEVRGYGNGARLSAMVQTVTQIGTLIASFSILVSVIWWASKIDTKQSTTTDDVAEIRVEAKEAAEERRELAENLLLVSTVLAKTTETLDALAKRLDDTRDIALGKPVEP
jgi:hypothetical protein